MQPVGCNLLTPGLNDNYRVVSETWNIWALQESVPAGFSSILIETSTIGTVCARCTVFIAELFVLYYNQPLRELGIYKLCEL